MSSDWKDYRRGWSFKGDVGDPEYEKSRSNLFRMNGNGWWWGWNHWNCPIKEMIPHFKHLHNKDRVMNALVKEGVENESRLV